MQALTLIEATARDGALVAPDWLPRAEAVHRQLRPQIPIDYTQKMQRVFAGGGRLLLAVSAESVLGLAVWRSHENTFSGRFLYVDDLVTDEAHRSGGVGRALLGHCELIARELGCADLILDSGVQRFDAHRFYFREGLVIKAYSFGKSLKD